MYLFLKSLYELKQLSQIYYQIFYDFLMNFNLKSIETNLCVYISKSKHYFIITLGINNGFAINSLST